MKLIDMYSAWPHEVTPDTREVKPYIYYHWIRLYPIDFIEQFYQPGLPTIEASFRERYGYKSLWWS